VITHGQRRKPRAYTIKGLAGKQFGHPAGIQQMNLEKVKPHPRVNKTKQHTKNFIDKMGNREIAAV